jgi:hypothetical protein
MDMTSNSLLPWASLVNLSGVFISLRSKAMSQSNHPEIPLKPIDAIRRNFLKAAGSATLAAPLLALGGNA